MNNGAAGVFRDKPSSATTAPAGPISDVRTVRTPAAAPATS